MSSCLWWRNPGKGVSPSTQYRLVCVTHVTFFFLSHSLSVRLNAGEKTFTVERPAVKMTMKKARKKKSNGSLVENGQQPSASKKAQPHSSTPMKAKSHSTTTVKPTSSPSAIKRPSDWLATPPTTKDNSSQQRSSPISLALPPSQPPIQHRKDTLKAPPPPPPPLDTTDSFDDDILRDMDEILNSNDEDEGNDDDDDEFETITSPYHANVDQTIHASPQSVQPLTPNTGKRRRPALKMASAPIRRLDASPPTPAPVTTLPRQQQQQQGNKRPRVGGKTISAETLAARRKAASAIRSDSSSGSSSSDTDSDDDSGSSGSDSDSDSDMDLLAANISRGLSEEVVAPSPYSHTTMNNLTPNNSSSSNLTPNGLVNGGSARPRSLRDLLGKKQTEGKWKRGLTLCI